jgi:hypothetical protein
MGKISRVASDAIPQSTVLELKGKKEARKEDN